MSEGKKGFPWFRTGLGALGAAALTAGLYESDKAYRENPPIESADGATDESRQPETPATTQAPAETPATTVEDTEEAMETFTENNGLHLGFNGLPLLQEGQTRRAVMVVFLPETVTLPAGYAPRYNTSEVRTVRPMTQIDSSVVVNGQTVQRQISVPGFRLAGTFSIDSFASPLEGNNGGQGVRQGDENFYSIANADALNLSPHDNVDARAYATGMTGVLVEVLDSRGNLVGYTDPRWTQRGESRANDGREGAMVWTYHTIN